MANTLQLKLPRLKVARLVSSKNPQPKTSPSAGPRKFEILHRPFDLAFRGRINSWLTQLDTKNISSLLNKKDRLLIKLYFFPQGREKKWLNQNAVLRRTGVGNKKKLKHDLVRNLLKVWDKYKN